MPKPRKGGAPQTLFAVSPWHDKAAHKDAEPSQAADGGPTYQVVDEQLLIHAPAAAPGQQKTTGGAGAANGGQVKEPEAAGAASPPPAAEAAADSKPAWNVRRKVHRDSAPAAEQPAADAEEGSGLEQEAPAHPAAELQVLEGTAVLALLPNNSITGHFIPHEGRRRSIGLMGAEVMSYRDCTRDTEWRVLRTTAIDFSGGREAAFLVERTEGDAMRLRAPIAWQGQEAGMMEQLGQGCQAGMELEFDCAQLLVGAAADAELRKLQPSLCERGALVNVGPMRLAWPYPPTQQQQQRPKPQPQRQHGQGGQQQQQQQQREGGVAMTAPRSGGRLTGGSGSGRAVTDSEDLW